jgi:hypothetical protein
MNSVDQRRCAATDAAAYAYRQADFARSGVEKALKRLARRHRRHAEMNGEKVRNDGNGN